MSRYGKYVVLPRSWKLTPQQHRAMCRVISKRGWLPYNCVHGKVLLNLCRKGLVKLEMRGGKLRCRAVLPQQNNYLSFRVGAS